MKCPRCGKLLSRTILNEDDVRAIYEATAPIVQLAKDTGLSRQTIWKIKTGRSHKFVNVNKVDEKPRQAKPVKTVVQTPEKTKEPTSLSDIIRARRDAASRGGG